MTTWIVYYSDGSSFSSDDGPPEDAPRTQVQVVVNYSEARGKLPWHSIDYYCWQGSYNDDRNEWIDGEWVPHSLDGLHDYLAEKVPKHIVLRSYGIPAKAFMEIYDKAIKDPRMPWVTGVAKKLTEPLDQLPPSLD